MQEKTLSELAVSYKETSSAKIFMEIMKRMKPAIRRWSAGARVRVSDDDIQQQAALAIASSIPRYDPEKGEFEAFAIPHLRSAFQQAALQTLTVTVSDSAHHRGIIKHVPRLMSELMSDGHSRHEALSIAAEKYGITTSSIERIFGVYASASGVEELDFGMHHEPTMDDTKVMVRTVMEVLDASEREIITRRYLAEETESLREIASDVAPGSNRGCKVVSERAGSALKRMRAALQERGITAHDVFA